MFLNLFITDRVCIVLIRVSLKRCLRISLDVMKLFTSFTFMFFSYEF